MQRIKFISLARQKPRQTLIFFIKHAKADSAEQDYQARNPSKRRKPKIHRPCIEQNKSRAKANRDIRDKANAPLEKDLRFFSQSGFYLDFVFIKP